MESKEAVEVLAALAQETRLDAFRLLVQAGPRGMPAGQIAQQLSIPAPTLSFHLKALSHAGLIRSKREGRSLLYAADFGEMEAVLRFLTEKCCQQGGC